MKEFAKVKDYSIVPSVAKNFQWSISLEIHERIHKGERPFNCSICHKNKIPEIYKSMKEFSEVGVWSVLTVVRNHLIVPQ